jgi:hypothetical protein
MAEMPDFGSVTDGATLVNHSGFVSEIVFFHEAQIYKEYGIKIPMKRFRRKLIVVLTLIDTFAKNI